MSSSINSKSWITVANIPHTIDLKDLMLHFMDKRNGGCGDVESAEWITKSVQQNDADQSPSDPFLNKLFSRVYFASEKTVKSVLSKTHSFDNQKVLVFNEDEIFGDTTTRIHRIFIDHLNSYQKGGVQSLCPEGIKILNYDDRSEEWEIRGPFDKLAEFKRTIWLILSGSKEAVNGDGCQAVAGRTKTQSNKDVDDVKPADELSVALGNGCEGLQTTEDSVSANGLFSFVKSPPAYKVVNSTPPPRGINVIRRRSTPGEVENDAAGTSRAILSVGGAAVLKFDESNQANIVNGETKQKTYFKAPMPDEDQKTACAAENLNVVVDQVNGSLANLLRDGDDVSSSSQGDKAAVSAAKSLTAVERRNKEVELECPICFDPLSARDFEILQDCQHKFHKDCIMKWFATNVRCCPVCKKVYGVSTGNQPYGRMKVTVYQGNISGFACSRHFEIRYDFCGGVQSVRKALQVSVFYNCLGKMHEHPNPGLMYSGTSRTAYLPDTPHGRIILGLFKLAFQHRLIFSVGTSVTTGEPNTVVWNGIHHKTSLYGGTWGYPDKNYLDRVEKELANFGLIRSMITDPPSRDFTVAL